MQQWHIRLRISGLSGRRDAAGADREVPHDVGHHADLGDLRLAVGGQRRFKRDAPHADPAHRVEAAAADPAIDRQAGREQSAGLAKPELAPIVEHGPEADALAFVVASSRRTGIDDDPHDPIEQGRGVDEQQFAAHAQAQLTRNVRRQRLAPTLDLEDFIVLVRRKIHDGEGRRPPLRPGNGSRAFE
ncbi:MAG: hypothetical protein JNK67_26510 [Alphaproteobacteria bacterium]|nr:hypothetical protein [Alphaproteobacteria bacterium]